METNVPFSKNLDNRELQELFIKTQDWLEEMSFLEIDFRFFNKLIKNYLALAAQIPAGQMKILQDELFDLQMNHHALRVAILSHRDNLDCTLRDLLTSGKRMVKDEHPALQEKVNQLNRAVRDYRTRLFRVTEVVLDGGPNESNR